MTYSFEELRTYVLEVLNQKLSTVEIAQIISAKNIKQIKNIVMKKETKQKLDDILKRLDRIEALLVAKDIATEPKSPDLMEVQEKSRKLSEMEKDLTIVGIGNWVGAPYTYPSVECLKCGRTQMFRLNAGCNCSITYNM